MENTGTKHCPYCGEEINASAKKCRYCGEWLVKDAERPDQPKEESKPQESSMSAADVMDTVSAGAGCLWSLFVSCIPIILLIYAYDSKPSLEEHKREVAKEVVECTKDKVRSTANMVIPGLGSLASDFIDGSIKDENIKELFYKNNRLELDNSWFWNTGVLYNSDNPDGTTVSFGICGFVIPLVEWDDFKLMDDESSSLLEVSSNNSNADSEPTHSSTDYDQYFGSSFRCHGNMDGYPMKLNVDVDDKGNATGWYKNVTYGTELDIKGYCTGRNLDLTGFLKEKETFHFQLHINNEHSIEGEGWGKNPDNKKAVVLTC